MSYRVKILDPDLSQITDEKIKQQILELVIVGNTTSDVKERKKCVSKIWRLLNQKDFNEKRKIWYFKNHKKHREYLNSYYRRNRDKSNAYARKWRKNNPELDYFYMKSGHLRRKYGITMEDYDNMIINQNNRCALCLKLLTGNTMYDVVDHCHKTNRVRGIIHRFCNTLLGHCKDEIEHLELAINYLKIHKWKK